MSSTSDGAHNATNSDRYTLVNKRNSLSVWCARRASTDSVLGAGGNAPSASLSLCPTSGIWEGLGGQITEEEEDAGEAKLIYSAVQPKGAGSAAAEWALRVGAERPLGGATAAAPYSLAAENVLNSLGWDYTCELECLQGNDGTMRCRMLQSVFKLSHK